MLHKNNVVFAGDNNTKINRSSGRKGNKAILIDNNLSITFILFTPSIFISIMSKDRFGDGT